MAVNIIRNIDIGDVPRTPAISIIEDSVTPVATESIIDIAKVYGFPISYKQEQYGRLIQNILPVHKTELQQISTSSRVELYLHTETAFHPFKPSFVILLCLRGDESAITTYSVVDDFLSDLSQSELDILTNSPYTTSLDDSFRANGEIDVELDVTALKIDELGNADFTFDWSLMRGKTPEAQAVLEKVKSLISASTREVVLRDSEAMIINNKKCVHGRKPFQPRYDGTDRWVKRILSIDKLPPQEHMSGSMITTEFSNAN